jgi:hypothetical protein
MGGAPSFLATAEALRGAPLFFCRPRRRFAAALLSAALDRRDLPAQVEFSR